MSNFQQLLFEIGMNVDFYSKTNFMKSFYILLLSLVILSCQKEKSSLPIEENSISISSQLKTDKLQIFETGVRYQFMHAMALITLAIYCHHQHLSIKEQKWIGWAAHFFIAGTLLFSGSLYILTLLSATNHPLIRLIGPITPLGGLCFILGWCFWLWVVYLKKVDK